MNRKAAIVFARMSSSRLPGKALLPLRNGFLLIELIIKQLRRLQGVTVILATSTRPEDDPLVENAKHFGALIFRGDLHNVAKRTVDCLNYFNIEFFARINGDSPFVCNLLIEEGFKKIENDRLDLITNIFPRTFPYGYSLEILNSKSFQKAYTRFSIDEREHITTYFYNNISLFKYMNVRSDISLDGSERLTIDTTNDYNNINRLLEKYPDIYQQSVEDILKAYKDVASV